MENTQSKAINLVIRYKKFTDKLYREYRAIDNKLQFIIKQNKQLKEDRRLLADEITRLKERLQQYEVVTTIGCYS